MVREGPSVKTKTFGGKQLPFDGTISQKFKTRKENRHMWHKPLVLGILLTSFVLSGCATVDSKLKAPPSQGAGFVPVEEMAKHPDLPFNKAWLKEGVDWQSYETIYIAPVNTDYLMQANWWQQNIRAGQMQHDVQDLATFMQREFIRAFQDDPKHRFRVVMISQESSLTLEMALTELVPSNVLLDAIKVGGQKGSGAAAAVLERATEAQSTVAFEARIKDTNTGEIVGMAADREYAITRPIDLRGMTWYGNAKQIITTWSQQFVDVANGRPGEIVKPASTFSLKPW
jgi:hypothetical protein